MLNFLCQFIILCTTYIKTTKGYTPEGPGNNKKDIDSSHSIKENLLLHESHFFHYLNKYPSKTEKFHLFMATTPFCDHKEIKQASLFHAM